MKIYLVVNVSRIVIYQEQIEEQKKIPPLPVEIDKEKKYEVEKILNRRDIREKPKYLVKQKEYIIEKDIWEGLENLRNTMDLVEEFEKKIREEKIKRVQIKNRKKKKKVLNLEIEVFKRSELLGKYIAKILFRQDNGKFEDKYLKKLGEMEKKRKASFSRGKILKERYYHSMLEHLYSILILFFFYLFIYFYSF